MILGLAARVAAAGLLSDVLDDGRSLNAVIEASDSPLADLQPQGRALARAIVSTALRRHGQIEAAFGVLIERKLPRRAGALSRVLEIAATQLLFMEVPDHAAVSLALKMADADAKARHFKPLANGVLRTLIRRRDEILADQDAARLNTPGWLWDRWVDAYGSETTRAIAEAHLDEPSLDLTIKADPAVWADRLGGVVLPTGTVRLQGKGRVEARPGYDEGAWWVQDAAAALPARLLGDVAGKTVLDLCAAPGGKTVQLANAGALVTAVDISAERVGRLEANLKRLGLRAESVVADALAYDPGKSFDAILVDAPCTATGTVRRHPDIPWLKQEADIAKFSRLQRLMIEKAAKLTRPGGTVLFATCSLQPEEGEGQALAALAGLPLTPWPIEAGEVGGLRGDWIDDGWLRTLPCHRPAEDVGGGLDGFFAARFHRL